MEIQPRLRQSAAAAAGAVGAWEARTGPEPTQTPDDNPRNGSTAPPESQQWAPTPGWEVAWEGQWERTGGAYT
jgi:hypothetical protein